MEAKEIETAALDIMLNRGIHMKIDFVPMSKSRNAAGEYPTFNYKITLVHGPSNQPMLVTDYHMGCAHSESFHRAPSHGRDAVLAKEVETGVRHLYSESFDRATRMTPREVIDPKIIDVLMCLVLDAQVIECGSFSDWCAEYGYSDDSIKAKETYEACLTTGLRMRQAFGDADLSTLTLLSHEW